MAKCIRLIGVTDTAPIRTTDDEAFRNVNEGRGEYCSKSFWREYHTENPNAIEHSGALLRLSADKPKSDWINELAA